MIYDGIKTDTACCFMGFAHKCVKCGRRADE